MDEIDFLKKVFKIITISFSVITFFVLFVVLREIANKEVVLYALMICGGVYAIDIIMYYILKTIFIGRNSLNYLKNNDLYRNILTNYPPAIYSFLYKKNNCIIYVIKINKGKLTSSNVQMDFHIVYYIQYLKFHFPNKAFFLYISF